jgi:hypothetical protein
MNGISSVSTVDSTESGGGLFAGLDNDIYRYLSGDKLMGKEIKVKARATPHTNKLTSADATTVQPASSSSTSEGGAGSNDDVDNDVISKYIQNSGYTVDELKKYVGGFYACMSVDGLYKEVFEQLVDEIHNTISTKLWTALRDVYGFQSFINIIRNTFLMGKGELMQLVLDGITAQTFLPNVDTRKANMILETHVTSSAGTILGE